MFTGRRLILLAGVVLLVAGVIGLCSAGAYVVFIPGEPIQTTVLARGLA